MIIEATVESSSDTFGFFERSMTVSDWASYHDVTVGYVRQCIASGNINAVKHGRWAWRIDPRDVSNRQWSERILANAQRRDARREASACTCPNCGTRFTP